MKLKYAVCTDQGKRYDHNEDHFALPQANHKFHIEPPDTEARGELFVVCDGMGGGQAGEIASEMAANWVMRHYYHEPMAGEPAQQLESAIHSVNHKIYQLAQEHAQYRGMATTLIALLIVNGRYIIRGVGDSRVYRLDASGLQQLSEDQSEVWTLYKRGFIDQQQMRRHPRNNIVEQVIGIEAELKLGFSADEGSISADESYLLCSDGLTDMVTDAVIREVMCSEQELQQKTDTLIQLANEAGGKDNITALIVSL